MNLILIGYRGTGKTSVAKILALRLHSKLISTDEEIVMREKMRIPEIVEMYGWNYFRDAESEVIKEISREDDCIIDAGGGVVLREENIKNLRRNGNIVLLYADVNTIATRIKDDAQRPSLTGKKTFIDEIEDVIKERNPLYEKSADFSVDTTNLTVEEVVERIIEYLKR